MFFIVKMKVNKKVVTVEGTIDYIVLQYKKQLTLGSVDITHVKEDKNNEIIDSKVFERRVLRIMKANANGTSTSEPVKETLLVRGDSMLYNVDSQIENGNT